MKGYRSLDGGAVVNGQVTLSECYSIWEDALDVASETEYVSFSDDYFYSVRYCSIRARKVVYRYKVSICDREKNEFFTILLDPKGNYKVEIRYAAQRMNCSLNLDYRLFFDYLNVEILTEEVSRLDLSLTVLKPIEEIVYHVVEKKYSSVLKRVNYFSYGDPTSPSSIRFGDIHNVEVSIYDKSKEAFDNSFRLEYRLKLDDLNEVFGDSPNVSRIEWRLGRRYLKAVGLTSPDDINNSIFDLYLTMQTRYFCPTDSVPDGHHKIPNSSWWDDLPSLEGYAKDQKGRIMFITDLQKHVGWSNKFKMMFSRTKGYISSIVASMARVADNVDTALQEVFKRLIFDSKDIDLRARAKVALC